MATTTPNYDINYDDERFQAVNDKWDGISDEVANSYQGMINSSDRFYQNLQDTMKQNAEVQKQNQQANTDFTIEKIEQQKEQARKDYTKEQSGAYQDWQKQSNQYGVNAEKMAAQGMDRTGFSESSKVAMYNQYQNRVATAREVLSQAMLNYDNNIKEAMLQNNSILAQIEAETALKMAELALDGFQYKNNLILESTNKKIELEQMRSDEWYKVLNQMNTENQFKESIRQYEQNFAEDVRQYEQNFAEDVRQFEEGQRFQAEENQKDREHQSSENEKTRQFQEKEAQLDRAHAEKLRKIDQDFEEKKAKVEQQYKLDLVDAETKAEKEIIEKEYAEKKAYLEEQTKAEKELADKELADQKALIDYQLKAQQPKVANTTTAASRARVNKETIASGKKQNNSAKAQVDRYTLSGENREIDQASVKALGLNSASELYDYVKQGKVVLKKGNNGKLKAEWSSSWKAVQNTMKSTFGVKLPNNYKFYSVK